MKKRSASDFLSLLSTISVSNEPEDPDDTHKGSEKAVELENEFILNLPSINFDGKPITFKAWFNSNDHDFTKPRQALKMYQHEEKMILSDSDVIPSETPTLNKLINSKKNMEILSNEYAPSIFDYRDFFYVGENFEDYRKIAALKVVNHIYDDMYEKKNRESPDARDSSYTMSSVLVICPTRKQAYEFINEIISVLPENDPNSGEPFVVQNFDRFNEEYSVGEVPQFILKTKPKDWLRTFGGNNSNEFRMGIRFFDNKIKLFNSMEKSQLIIGSSLSLFLHEDKDFMSSIEVLVLDSLDVLMAQQGDRLLQLILMLNKLPQKVNATDWGHLRLYCTDKQQEKLRQNIIYSSVLTPEMHNMFSKFPNIRGQLIVRPLKYPPLLIPGLDRSFKKLECQNVKQIGTALEKCFDEKLYPLIKQWRSEPEETAKRTIIYYVSSYRFYQARKKLETNMVNFLELSDEATKEDSKRMKKAFNDDPNAVLLVTERFYFHFRPKFRDVQRVVFIQPPTFPQFVPELAGNCSAIFYFTEFDEIAIERIVGSELSHSILSHDFYTL